MTLGRLLSGHSAITESQISDRMQYHGQTGGGYPDMYQSHQYQAYQPQPMQHGPSHPGSAGTYGGFPIHQYSVRKGHSSGKHHGGYHGKKGAALSALTLLAFMFFLNILQNCLRDQMNSMNPQVTVMTAGQKSDKTLDEAMRLDANEVVETQNPRPPNDRFASERENVFSVFKVDRVHRPTKADQELSAKEDSGTYQRLIGDDD